MTPEERIRQAVYALTIMMGTNVFDIPEILHILEGKHHGH